MCATEAVTSKFRENAAIPDAKELSLEIADLLRLHDAWARHWSEDLRPKATECRMAEALRKAASIIARDSTLPGG